jgi:UvrD-like helicase family protein
VVIPLTASSWMMLRRNLLYTGITRARKLIILARSRRALAQAVRTPGAGRRHTAPTQPPTHPPTGSTPPGRRANPAPGLAQLPCAERLCTVHM